MGIKVSEIDCCSPWSSRLRNLIPRATIADRILMEAEDNFVIREIGLET